MYYACLVVFMLYWIEATAFHKSNLMMLKQVITKWEYSFVTSTLKDIGK